MESNREEGQHALENEEVEVHPEEKAIEDAGEEDEEQQYGDGAEDPEDAGEGEDDYAEDDEEEEEMNEGLDDDGAGAVILEDEDDGEDDEEDEINLDNYTLPPLPPATAPLTVRGIGLDEIYSIIEELRRQMDDPVERERAKEMLTGDADVLMAVAQVLQESKLLRRTAVNEETGAVEKRAVPQPEAPAPPLPAGYNSWVVEKKAKHKRNRRRR